jgi:hypothetical protein
VERLIVETKVLKQLVRDVIQPERDLGHSDKKGHKKVEETTESVMEVKGKVDGEKGTGDITESGSKEKPSASGDAATQFRGVAEQACEDCQ